MASVQTTCASPSAMERVTWSPHAQAQNARAAKTTAVADNRDAGRPVITTDRCAAIVKVGDRD